MDDGSNLWAVRNVKKKKKKKHVGRGSVKKEQNSAQTSFRSVALMDQQTATWVGEEYVLFLCELDENVCCRLKKK